MIKKKSSKPKVVVVGDTWVNNVLVPVPGTKKETGWETPGNWRYEKNKETLYVPGGALLVKDIIKNLSSKTDNFEALSYRGVDLENLSRGEIIRTLSEGKIVKESTGEETIYINTFLGCLANRSSAGVPAFVLEFPSELDDERQLIIIDDANLGFRKVEKAWKHVIKSAEKNKNTFLIYNMSAPLFAGDLWETISKKGILDQVLVIIQGDALRQEGVNISRNLSWDRTITDFLFKTVVYTKYAELEKCPHILVRFGLECAIYYHFHPDADKDMEKKRQAHVFYIPGEEERLNIEHPRPQSGLIMGLESLFTAFLAAGVMEAEKNGTAAAVSELIAASVPSASKKLIKLLYTGFKYKSQCLQLSFGEVSSGKTGKSFESLEFSDIDNTAKHDLSTWHILFHQIKMKPLLDVAIDYVTAGSVKELANVPVVNFGNLLTVDRCEIESFRSIRNLIREYLKNTGIKKPLSIAVFGPPGSGKSFTVENIAYSVSREKMAMLEYNVSQFESPQDIIRSFWEIRDFTVEREIPLVFFDEFDSAYQGESLGWLKYFLGPMQDGKYKAGEKLHPIGRAIFVFAGGTSSSLKEFSRGRSTNDQPLTEDIRQFISAKGPDFVSRLKGYVDILGPNPLNLEDDFYIIRRAVLLRALLLQEKNIVTEMGSNQHICIDKDLLRALLVIPRYKHGSRSIQAILNMSTLREKREFGKSSLPSSEQLNLHVDADIFMKTLDRDLFLKTVGEKMAKAVHESHPMRNPNEAGQESHTETNPRQDWESLDEEFRISSRNHAYDIPIKLLRIGRDYRPKPSGHKKKRRFRKFTQQEIETLARMEHKRWSDERKSNGWKYGPVRDPKKKIHPDLIPWEDLTEVWKERERDFIREIPKILDLAGFEIFHLF